MTAARKAKSNVVRLLPERAASARGRRRGDDVDSAADTRDAILVAGNLIAGAFDLLDGLQRKEPLLVAAKKAVRKTKKRAKALRDASASEDEEPSA